MNRAVQWRYVVIGVGFLGLAGVRASQGAPVWAAVFLAAALVNAWLALQETRPAADSRATVDVTAVDGSEVERSMEGYRASGRQWQVLGVACLLVGGGLLLLEPPLAVFAGAAALFALHRARRSGRAVATLERVRLVGK